MLAIFKQLMTSLIAISAYRMVAAALTDVRLCSGPGQCPLHFDCTLTARGGHCDCISGYFLNAGECIKAIELGQTCRDYGQCVQHAECGVDRSGVCECKSGYYASAGVCKSAIGLGEKCVQGEKCVNKAECVGSRCVCGQGFHNYRGHCTKSSLAGELCFSSEECIRTTHCSADHICVCDVGVANADGLCV
nr:hypothetical protein BgiMline_015124 [Biomphalaria glabrata]